MERMATKSVVVGGCDQDRSFRSNRTVLYNIHDYLPPSAPSRASLFATRHNDKTYTEPNDRPAESAIKRELEREQEKEGLKREVQRLTSRLEMREKELREREREVREQAETIELLNSKIGTLNCRIGELQEGMRELTSKLELKPALSHSRNNLHFIYFPKFTQRYEISVQTEALEYHPLPHSKPQTARLDPHMAEIQQKLATLNQFKKPNKEKSFKQQEFPKFEKADMFSKLDDKENVMRLSNTFERLTSIPEDRVREESVEIMPVDADQAERLIRLYME